MIDSLLGIERRGVLDNPNISLHDPQVWEEVFGDRFQTHSGVKINATTCLEYSPVWQAVNLISGDVAKLPLEKFKRLDDDTREPATSSPAYKLVRRRANPEQSAFDFWRRLMVHALVWNNAYALITYNGRGEAVEMFPLLPDRTKWHIDDDGAPWIVSFIGDKWEAFWPSQVFHLAGISYEGRGECVLVEKARNSWALGLAAEQYAGKFFSSGGRVGGVLELPAAMDKAPRDKVEQQFRATYEGVDNAFKTVILRDNAKFHAAQFKPDDGQMTQSRNEQVREVARWFNLPPHKLGDDSRTSYNSLEQENRAYLDSTLSHWMRAIESQCWLKLLTPREQQSESHYFEYNVGAFISTDIQTQYSVGRQGIEMGVLSPNEFRKMQNLPPREGGDVWLTPLNFEHTGPDAPEEPEPPPPPLLPMEEDEEEGEEPAAPPIAALAEANYMQAHERAARQLVAVVLEASRRRKPSSFLRWFDEHKLELIDEFNLSVGTAYALLSEAQQAELGTAQRQGRVLGPARILGVAEGVLSCASTEQFREALVKKYQSIEGQICCGGDTLGGSLT